jgi:hypothetical protein
VLGRAEPVGFPRLGHQVQHEHARGRGRGDRLHQLRHEERRKQAGIEAAGTDDDEVGFTHRVDRRLEAARALRAQREPHDPGRRRSDRRLAEQRAAIFEFREERHRFGRRGEHRAAGSHDASGQLHRPGEVVGHIGERREHQVAECVSVQAVPRAEAVLEQFGEQPLVLRQRRKAVAHVTGRHHPELAAQPAGTAAVIGRGDDGHKLIARGRLALGIQQWPQPAQHVRQTRTPADRDHPREVGGARRQLVPAGSGRERGHLRLYAHASDSVPVALRAPSSSP